MNQRPDKSNRRESPDDLPDDDLPPLAEDEEAGDLDLPLDSFLEEQRDDGMSWLDDRVGIEDYDDDEVADELGAVEGLDEPTWLDDSEADDALAGTEADIEDDAEYGWTEDNEIIGADGDWDGEMDFGDESAPSILDDAGEEGLDDEPLDLDMSHWSKLEGEVEDDGFDDDEVLELEGALSFEEEARLGGDLLPPLIDDSQVEVVWLGPTSASVATVAFRGAALFAAGDGLFAPVDNDLVPTGASASVEEARATTLEIDPLDKKTLWIGTETAGLLVSRDAGETVTPINGWTTAVRGCGTPSRPLASVRAAVTSPTSAGDDTSSVVWVLTDRGHLTRSADAGETWTRELPGREVRALAADARSPRVALLVRDEEGLAVLVGSGVGEYERRLLPDEASVVWASLDPVLALSGDTILVGDEDLVSGVLCSTSPETGWRPLGDCPRSTAAAAVTAGGSTTLWVALFFAGKDLGTLLRQRGGGPWQRICDVARLSTLLAVDQIGVEEVSMRIHEIAVNPDDPRQVALATGRGVFVIQTKDPDSDDARER